MKFLKANSLSLVVLGLTIATTIYLYGDLPDRIPTNYNLDGDSTSDTSKLFIAFLIPSIYLLVIFVANFLVNVSPEKYSLPNSKRAMDIVIFGVGLLLACIHIGLLTSDNDLDRFLQFLNFGLATFLIVSGNVIGKIERNFFVGLKLPWTLASSQNWRATHRLAGKLTVVAGIILLATTLFWQSLFQTLFLTITPLLIAVVYSYLYYSKHERNGKPTSM